VYFDEARFEAKTDISEPRSTQPPSEAFMQPAASKQKELSERYADKPDRAPRPASKAPSQVSWAPVEKDVEPEESEKFQRSGRSVLSDVPPPFFPAMSARSEEFAVPRLMLQGSVELPEPSSAASSRSGRSVGSISEPGFASGGFGNAFTALTSALFKGADALLESDSSRTTSSAGAWEMPARNIPVADQAMAALTVHQAPKWEIESEAQLTDHVHSGRSAGSIGSSATGSLGGALASIQRSMPEQTTASVPGSLAEELLSGLQGAMHRPSEAELSAMAGRIATAKRMTHMQEMQVRGMLREIADALFDEPRASDLAAASPSRSQSGLETARSSVHTARSSVRSQTEASSDDGALDEEVHGLLDELYGKI